MARKLALVIGAPRQGKTYFAEKTAIAYAQKGGVSVVYNVGMPTDFSDFVSVSLMTPHKVWELARSKGRQVKLNELTQEIHFFKHNDSGKVFHLKDFVKMFKGKCVKIERLDAKRQEERMFYKAIFNYLFNCLVIFDDYGEQTAHGLPAEMIELLSRSNHTGKTVAENPAMCGVDVIIIWHQFSEVPNRAYNYANSIVQFKTASPPRLRFDPEKDSMLNENYNWLQSSPQFSRVEMDTISLTSKRIPHV